MCQMALEALFQGSTIASCSSKMITSSLGSGRASEPRCNSFIPCTAKYLRANSRVVTSNVTSKKSASRHAIAAWPKHEQLINQKVSNVDEQFSSPDRWMEDSVCDIVRNINEAPFLHMLFDSKDNTTAMTSQVQKVQRDDDLSTEERWKEVKDCVSRASPDGVILVHHLDDDSMKYCCMGDGSAVEVEKIRDGYGDKSCRRGTDLWGVLVLGKTIARSACYILKTTSVASSFGTCTGFCLTKAKCFGSSWHDQMQSSWLLGTENHQHNR